MAQNGESKAQPRAPLQRVLVATDFSKSARRAARRAVRLPLAPRARVGLVHVIPDKLPEPVRVRLEAAAHDGLERTVKEASEAAARLGRGDVKITSCLARGRPFVEIIRRARATGAELILMGRGAPPRGVRSRLLGQVAERVVRKGDVPVLVVAEPPGQAYRQVLAAIDLSDTSHEIVELALRVAPVPGRLEIFHAYQLPFEGAMETYLPEDQVAEYRVEMRQTANLGTQRLVESLEPPAGLELTAVVRRGEPRRLVLEEAVRRGADLIVLGTHGRSGLSHALLGSVAESVVRTSPCDVLIARPTRFTFEMP